jgi:hypothetical protein
MVPGLSPRLFGSPWEICSVVVQALPAEESNILTCVTVPKPEPEAFCCGALDWGVCPSTY